MRLYILIGLPGVGKSTWATSRFSKKQIYSSDTYRKEILGDESNQEHNEEIFKYLHEDMRHAMLNNRSDDIVYDATNLSIKRRKNIIDMGHNHNIEVYAVVFSEPIEIVLEQNENRHRVVPEEYIKLKYQSFHVPVVTENWDGVIYVGCHGLRPKEFPIRQFVRDIGLHMHTRLDKMDGFNQHNPHHNLDLMDHTMAVYRHLSKNNADWRIQLAALYHDVGKLDTQTFDSDGVAHYYGHQYVSTQIAIQELRNLISVEDLQYVTSLIHYHMDLYNHKAVVDVAKLARRLNHPRLFNDLILLHEADQIAH